MEPENYGRTKPEDFCSAHNHLLLVTRHGYRCEHCMIYFPLGYFSKSDTPNNQASERLLEEVVSCPKGSCSL